MTFGVYLKSGKSRRKSLQNEINVKYVTFDEQFNKNVIIINEIRPLRCENTTFCVCILVDFSLNML